MATRTYSLSDFADDYLGAASGRDHAAAGPASWKVAEATQSELLASPLIATVLWQAFLRGDGLSEQDIPVRVSDQDEVYVVRHPLRAADPRHDLMILVKDWPEEIMPEGSGRACLGMWWNAGGSVCAPDSPSEAPTAPR